MRRWLRDPLPQIPENPEIPQIPERPPTRGRLSSITGISGISGISGSALRPPRDEVPCPVEPERWAEMLRGLAVDGVRLDLAADALESLMDSGAVERALILGWDARELIGVQRAQPHDHPSRAGLIFSLRPGDTVPDVRASGSIISSGNVRHIWRRSPLPCDGSICLPWEIRA